MLSLLSKSVDVPLAKIPGRGADSSVYSDYGLGRIDFNWKEL
jgi:hypothetical protein